MQNVLVRLLLANKQEQTGMTTSDLACFCLRLKHSGETCLRLKHPGETCLPLQYSGETCLIFDFRFVLFEQSQAATHRHHHAAQARGRERD
jgi:hypothetical protein